MSLVRWKINIHKYSIANTLNKQKQHLFDILVRGKKTPINYAHGNKYMVPSFKESPIDLYTYISLLEKSTGYSVAVINMPFCMQ